MNCQRNHFRGFRRRDFRGRGFTLIEIVAVLVLMGLLASAVAWTMADRQQSVLFDDVADQIEQLDALSRIYARRFNQAIILHIDLDEQTLWRSQEDTQYANDDLRSHRLMIPDRYRIVSIITPQQTVDDRRLDLPIGPEGRSESYAVQLTDSQDTRWLMVSGMTGRIHEYADEQSIENIFAMLRPVTD
ncbi:prepilin-type N-terminal cleavage/methylation domain-containing protein [Planctomycetales bacterium ZRK34]|nr:prepilin-type N-terminal cleavage/methylation domain-containing protein [Planctomycetales bacterium ZRK34]